MSQTSSDLSSVRHSLAHILAEAVVLRVPEAKIGIGPATADGFYYDFDLPVPLTAMDLEDIEVSMRRLLKNTEKFRYREVSTDEALELFKDQPYKLELIDNILNGSLDADGEPTTEATQLSTYRHGAFEDLCRGPHVTDISDINPKAFKLVRTASAYWRGDETRPTLQRIYGFAFENQEELEHYVWQQEEARKRDHRRLGEQLDIFAFTPEIGKGLPLWLPKGTIIRDELERFAKRTEKKWGYQRIATPHITKSDLYHLSGHLPYYADDLYSPINIEGDEYYLKPMNCPHHHMVYKARPHSYRELPIRYAEYGTVYRYEKSGQLHGLMRTRGFTQNDAHIYCTMAQAKEEFTAVMRLHEYYYRALGITDFHMVLALRDPSNLNKYHEDEQMWKTAESITREAMDESNIPYIEDIGGAAHYGPKVDFIIKSVTGKEFGASTNQVDLYMPGRFGLTYATSDHTEEEVVVIHRAPLGSHERFVGFLLEYYAGDFPLWLSPEQVRVVPITEDQHPYAQRIADHLDDAEMRSTVDDSDNRMQAKIRVAEMEKVPVTVVVGRREQAEDTVSVRLRHSDENRTMSLQAFYSWITEMASTRALSLSFA